MTQFSSMVDKLPVKMARQRYFGYSDELNDKKYLRNFIGDRVGELEGLEVGEFLYDCGRETMRFRVPRYQNVARGHLN